MAINAQGQYFNVNNPLEAGSVVDTVNDLNSTDIKNIAYEGKLVYVKNGTSKGYYKYTNNSWQKAVSFDQSTGTLKINL